VSYYPEFVKQATLHALVKTARPYQDTRSLERQDVFAEAEKAYERSKGPTKPKTQTVSGLGVKLTGRSPTKGVIRGTVSGTKSTISRAFSGQNSSGVSGLTAVLTGRSPTTKTIKRTIPGPRTKEDWAMLDGPIQSKKLEDYVPGNSNLKAVYKAVRDQKLPEMGQNPVDVDSVSAGGDFIDALGLDVPAIGRTARRLYDYDYSKKPGQK